MKVKNTLTFSVLTKQYTADSGCKVIYHWKKCYCLIFHIGTTKKMFIKISSIPQDSYSKKRFVEHEGIVRQRGLYNLLIKLLSRDSLPCLICHTSFSIRLYFNYAHKVSAAHTCAQSDNTCTQLTVYLNI